jgi:hypothetical protein
MGERLPLPVFILSCLLVANVIVGLTVWSQVHSLQWSSPSETAERHHPIHWRGGRVTWVSERTAFWSSAFIPAQLAILGLAFLGLYIYRERFERVA